MLGLRQAKVANVVPFVDEELGGNVQEMQASEIVDLHARYMSPLPAVHDVDDASANRACFAQ